MKKTLFLFFITILVVNTLYAQVTFSGVLDSTALMNVTAGDSPDFTFGFEEYANMRFQARLREGATINGAVNLIAASGFYAHNAAVMAGAEFPLTSYYGGENFIAAIELERLQFRLRGEHIDFNGGLFRLPFGYSQVWGSSDFLNPKNPLKPDARPRGILGASVTWYPIDELKLLLFFASPRDAFEIKGGGSLFGISADRHWEKASAQVLYTFETPHNNYENGIHRAGLSVKADIKAGFIFDALYTYDPQEDFSIDGLSLSSGFDYSFLGGDLIILAEYLFNGKKSSTAKGYGGNFSTNHHLNLSFTYLINDYTNMSAAVIACYDDLSFTPVVSVNHDLFQGVIFTISAMASFNDNSRFSIFTCTTRVRIRF